MYLLRLVSFGLILYFVSSSSSAFGEVLESPEVFDNFHPRIEVHLPTDRIQVGEILIRD
jgi:hypothetical protein